MTDELHSSALISRGVSTLAKTLKALPKHDRLKVFGTFVNEVSSLPDVSVISIVLDKTKRKSKEEVFELAWKVLLQRFENTLRYRNFPGPMNSDERGILFPDNTDGEKLRTFLRSMRRHNPVPSRFGGTRNLKVETIIEDPNMRDSRLSYFIQAVDCVAYALKQFVDPSGYMKRKGGNAYFKRLRPVLCLKASTADPLGIVRL